jgi:hypothetical protein
MIIKLTIRSAIRLHHYAYLTGITQQQEATRIKEWRIVIDTQLTGGDVEISRSRLILTLLASTTLPSTPGGLMLQALHIRLLLWNINNTSFNGFNLIHWVASKLARWKWNKARKLITRVEQDDELPDGLPEYLVHLLEQECHEVLSDSICQRAYDLAWNLPTIHNTLVCTDGINDHAIRSPLDAIAAWYSSLVLQRALVESLGSSGDDMNSEWFIMNNIFPTINVSFAISTAISTAPMGSKARIQALIARGILVNHGLSSAQVTEILMCSEMRILTSSEMASSKTTTLNPIKSEVDIMISLHCAMAITHLARSSLLANLDMVQRHISTISPHNMTLLSFTAAFNLMEKINGHDIVAVTCVRSLETLASSCRMWIAGKEGEGSGLDKEVRRAIGEKCLDVTKRITGIENAGYESMSESDEESIYYSE